MNIEIHFNQEQLGSILTALNWLSMGVFFSAIMRAFCNK